MVVDELVRTGLGEVADELPGEELVGKSELDGRDFIQTGQVLLVQGDVQGLQPDASPSRLCHPVRTPAPGISQLKDAQAAPAQ